ncbi:MAG: right-handed parallel beta-helix repeat-containing protein [Euryarchaeota archaeon]|nr:right-handed parallel beta-helix repeat-containing protein [Euryarchaeota archaeon]
MKKNRSILIISLLFISILIRCVPTGLCETSTGSIFNVGGTGAGNYTNIQDAINVASAGDTVFVFNGTYHENLIVNTSIQLIGEDRNTTIINGSRNGCVIILTADQVTITGFTITWGGLMFPDAGICVESSDNTITKNTIVENYYGMHMSYFSGNTLISENYIANNHQCGIYFSRSSNNRLIGNTVMNQPSNGFGLYESSNNNTIIGNTLSHNGFCGVNIRDSFNNHVSNNQFIGNNIGLHVPPPDHYTAVCSNFFSDNHVAYEEGYDVSAFSLVIVMALIFIVFIVLKKKS